ncbi:MAG: hypothetical protein HYR88_12470 [Verrucomicrobia bacterium]|nr:hypothetical protein [Verrucomicrobiota bacterium]MBI3867576.1 hypothetical protein [Verrucomicrobiota bacterium]
MTPKVLNLEYDHNWSMKNTTRPFHIPVDRRRFFRSMAIASAGFTLSGYLAEALTLTPQATQGPYYPLASNIPLDKDNDLVRLNDSLTLASGLITHVSGRVLDSGGNPIRGALVELWHADNGGNYIYSTNSAKNPSADRNFAGFGQYLTGKGGGYRFRTIKAGLYTGRTRHFHFGITLPGRSRFTTQLFWAGESGNASDMVLSSIADATQRASVTKAYTAVAGASPVEVETTWDIVMGQTPIDPTYPGAGLLLAGAVVPGPQSGTQRFRITLPAYAGYTYEIYANPTHADLGWQALPFSLSQMGAIDRNKQTASADGPLVLYVDQKATKGFYSISFRVPGANTGTP